MILSYSISTSRIYMKITEQVLFYSPGKQLTRVQIQQQYAVRVVSDHKERSMQKLFAENISLVARTRN